MLTGFRLVHQDRHLPDLTSRSGSTQRRQYLSGVVSLQCTSGTPLMKKRQDRDQIIIDAIEDREWKAEQRSASNAAPYNRARERRHRQLAQRLCRFE
jgi:hypothetical protein